jgi:hypothetical protein
VDREELVRRRISREGLECRRQVQQGEYREAIKSRRVSREGLESRREVQQGE